jgi:Zn-dependent protease with chaperone function
MRFEARLFDGETASSRGVDVSLLSGGLEITDRDSGKVRLWTLSGLEAVDPPQPGFDLRLKHLSEPGSRLVVPAGGAARALVEAAPHLGRRVHPQKVVRHLLIAGAFVFALLAAGYLVLSLLPQTVADVMPESLRERLGALAERSLIEDAAACTAPSGLKAMEALKARLAGSLPEAPPFSVDVVELPVINAFALPGGRIIVSGRLIREADSPEEVAGVLAHELGHVAYRHPEAQFVRIMGLQLVLTLATGTSGGDTLGGLAGLLTILRYTREAERQADAFATRLMAEGRIDPMGLRDFFGRVRKMQGGSPGGVLSGIGDIFSTHPGTEGRIEAIEPLPEGTAREVIAPETFRELKAICGS